MEYETRPLSSGVIGNRWSSLHPEDGDGPYNEGSDKSDAERPVEAILTQECPPEV